MLVIRGISAGVVDYYLGPHGQEAGGSWYGRGGDGLGLSGPVQRAELTSVLKGRHPATGVFLPTSKPARRRAGWDLMFSTPKSVSLLGATDPGGGESVLDAHRRAVGRVLDHMESHLITVGRAGAPQGRVASEGAIFARFDHLGNAAGEPHMHTHVLMANLGRGPDGKWSAISGGDWKVWKRGLFALYSLGLRHELTRSGWQLDWRIRPDGLADLADVPRAAIRATSTQRAASRALGRFEARAAASPQPWREHLARAGFDQVAAPPGVSPNPDLPARPDPGMERTVTSRLAMQRSSFRQADVLVALAECHPGGLAPDEAHAWAMRFCEGSVPVPTTRPHPRWTTEMARGGDARLVALATQGRVEVLGSPPGEAGLVAHAQGIAERVDEWRSAGWTVAVDCRRERDAPRWRTLTGLPDTGSVVRPDVVLIDQADRRATPELLSLFAARSRDGLTLMVEGGTMPRRSEPASLGLVVLGDRLGRVRPEAGSTHPAIEELVGRWVALPGGPATALLVGLGPEEAQALNLSARRWATEVGRLDGDGPAVKAAGREYQAGDRVMVVNSEGIDRSRGSLGTVEQARASTRSLTVRWDDRSVEILSGSALRSLGYGYAATPELAGRIPGPSLFLLGPEQAVPGLARRVLASATTPDLPMGPARQRDLGLGL